MPPLDVEEHGLLDIDEDGVTLLVHEHVVWSKLPVDEAVVAPRVHDARQLTQLLFQRLSRLCHALEPGGGFRELPERASTRLTNH
jgi:hypothetical protein